MRRFKKLSHSIYEFKCYNRLLQDPESQDVQQSIRLKEAANDSGENFELFRRLKKWLGITPRAIFCVPNVFDNFIHFCPL